jgi:hypothetical protein
MQLNSVEILFDFHSEVWGTTQINPKRGVTSKTKFRNAVLYSDVILSGR